MLLKSPIKRNHFPYILGSSLIIIALAASYLGFFAYNNLNQIAGTLESDVKPNLNLLILNNLSNELEEVAFAMERYVYTNEEIHKDHFKDHISASILLLDSLKRGADKVEVVISIDTLKRLVLQKEAVLNQVAEMDHESIEETVSKLKLSLNDLPTKEIVEDTILRKKRGFLRKLFGKKEEVVQIDTVDIYNSEKYQRMVDSQFDSITQLSQSLAERRKVKEFRLQRSHQNIQTEISRILVRLEKTELESIQNQASSAKKIAENTNRFVSMFSIVLPILLLITLSVLLIYIFRTRKYQEALASSRRNALQLAKEKEQFLANMSHEIRTPMNAIGGFAKVLLKSDLKDTQKEYLTIIEKSTDHLTYILNDVLDFSKLQSGKIRLEEKAFSPTELLSDTVRLLEDKAKEKNLKLDFEAHQLPEWVQGDPHRLRQILLNIIYNGIKFTEKGGVRVTATCIKKSNSLANLVFEIADTGVGIATDKQSQIFNEFEQANLRDRSKGTGLGLSITKKLVSIHKGKISLNSKVGRGSTFTVTLPYKVADGRSPSLTPSLQTNVLLPKMHILIADDEEYNRKLLIAILKEYDVTFDVAIDGMQAYEMLRSISYDLVLMDFRLPKLDGPEIVLKIRNEKGPNSNAQIIGLTATVSDHDMEMAKKSGMHEVLRKPFDPDELLRLIPKEVNSTEAEELEDLTATFSLEGLKKMGDESFVRDMVETFISSTKENLHHLDTYKEEQNWHQVGEILHKIIAPARHLKASKIVALLKEYEKTSREGKPISESSYEHIKLSTMNLVDSLQLHLQENEV